MCISKIVIHIDLKMHFFAKLTKVDFYSRKINAKLLYKDSFFYFHFETEIELLKHKLATEESQRLAHEYLNYFV